MFQFMSNAVRSTVVVNDEAEPVGAEVVDCRAGRGAGQGGGLRDALDRDLAVDLDVVAVAADLV